MRLSLSLHRDVLLRHLVVKTVHVVWICSRRMLSYWSNISETSHEILLEPWQDLLRLRLMRLRLGKHLSLVLQLNMSRLLELVNPCRVPT